MLDCSPELDEKDGGGIQDERSECLSPSRGREYLVRAVCTHTSRLSNS